MRVLSRLFRRRFLELLQRAFDCEELQFFSALHGLREREAFRAYVEPLRKKEWVVYAKAPFAGAQQVLDYVGRYTHRVAISNNRLLNIEDGHVTFRWKDYRDGDAQKTMTLAAPEFIRRFLLHVLPSGLQRIRYYGWMGNRHREEKLALCRQHLKMEPKPEASDALEASTDYRDRVQALTGLSLSQCPMCRKGHMVTVEQIGRTASPPLVLNTS